MSALKWHSIKLLVSLNHFQDIRKSVKKLQVVRSVITDDFYS